MLWKGKSARDKWGPILTQDTTLHRHRNGILVVISGPSGVGKTSLCRQVVTEMPRVTQSVSYTTRVPRADERDGREYHFISHRAFKRRIGTGEFLEWAQVHGQLYGTSRQQVETITSAGTDILLAIDVQGGIQLRASDVDTVLVFLLPPSWDALSARLRKRGTEAPEVQKQRLEVARQELAHYTEYDYVVVNDQLPVAAEMLKTILRAERHHVTRIGKASIEELLAHYPAQ
jgi:guanylate kinase